MRAYTLFRRINNSNFNYFREMSFTNPYEIAKLIESIFNVLAKMEEEITQAELPLEINHYKELIYKILDYIQNFSDEQNDDNSDTLIDDIITQIDQIQEIINASKSSSQDILNFLKNSLVILLEYINTLQYESPAEIQDKMSEIDSIYKLNRSDLSIGTLICPKIIFPVLMVKKLQILTKSSEL